MALTDKHSRKTASEKERDCRRASVKANRWGQYFYSDGENNVDGVYVQVCAHAISSLNFNRSQAASLLPTAQGIYYFAFSAPVDLYSYNSRKGAMPAYSTISKTLLGLSDQAASDTLKHGLDPTKFGKIVFDNVQNYHRQRDFRIGRENKLNIGMAATYIELEGIDPAAFDLDDKRRRLAENKRSALDVDQLLGMIDEKHLQTVGILQWLRTLCTYIPELEPYKSHVSMLYCTRAAKLRLDVRATKVHPLATSSKKETVTNELRDGVLDFLEQIGQKQGEYSRRLMPIGGDGLTYDKLLHMKRYMQFHNDPFDSFELLEPDCEIWHMEWTETSSGFETHWGDLLSEDPATLGHSAHQIGWPEPSNLSKVDFYPASEFAFLTLDARMLHCWE